MNIRLNNSCLKFIAYKLVIHKILVFESTAPKRAVWSGRGSQGHIGRFGCTSSIMPVIKKLT